ncbi:hypothetical protein SERLA73DRAFT_158777 [Serpula lacrymans var. lacrymans S7.3]|uniref:Eukaryotic translation initiation factor 5B n=1 Tax=Serpula lacrymans var. lacrymans (strain S7.3) TaxID=936435 RepID=F8PPV7_SERL3|nr:hypothetical protein SERLA73DRAFT_158777 [Serpula lacrymans var. lacrymans S7.3]
MAPKNKGKKGKAGNDDDYWDKAGVSVENNNASATGTANVSDDENARPAKSGGGFSAFSMLQSEDAGAAQDEDEDFGGLMSAIKATSKGKKDKKKPKKAQAESFDDGGVDAEAPEVAKKPLEVTAEDLADEEWGPVKEKGKKAKKGKGKKGGSQDETPDAESTATPEVEKPAETKVESAPPAPVDEAEDGPAEDGDGDGAPKILSKKEKEKLKKEREKAAQAAAKKTGGDTPQTEAPAPPPTTDAQQEDDNEDGEAVEAGKADSKKKKKKKGKKDDEPAPAPAPAPAAGKKKGGISALKAMMEEKKRLEEEARRREEEERKRIEEEERLAEEEERKKEEEKQRKKEKEKAKRELAKKEGRLLTKKQKEEKAAAEIRKQALLASGVQIEGLQQAQSAAPVPKKVVYGNRKKKGPVAKDASPAPESRPRTPEPAAVVREPTPPPRKPSPVQPSKASSVKDDWDASSDEESKATAANEVKDSWDASSDEGDAAEPIKPPPAASSKPEKKANGQPEAKKTPAPEPAKASQPASKTAPAKKTKEEDPAASESESEESSSEEDSDSESGSDSDESSSSESEGKTATQRALAQKKADAAERRAKAHEVALAARNKDDLRSPICCILGHVDTGKTKLLDKIRQTNVQEGEAGGITQQIGATYFPVDAIKTKTAVLNTDGLQEYKIPGLLVIDTPGHESFTNLRSRGSSLCNIAILVVDIMHGLEPQTLESLRLLRDRKTPFIVALNKIDRMYGWEATPDGAFRDSLAKQKRSVQREFEDRVEKTILAFAEQGLNAVLYYDNKSFARNVSLVPTSAVTGEGVPDMILLLVNLTQQRMSDRLMYLSELECTVLEVKVVEGLGTTIDVVLSNGILREGDRIVICGLNGPIVTQVRALLTPQPLRELRIKSAYVHHKEVKAALGVKLVAPDLEKAIAGSRLMVVGPDDDEEEMLDEIMSDLTSLLNSIDKSGRGVCVQASTLGSLEALLDFLKVSKIPVSGINIGPVHKKDVMRCATMLEKAKELAVILCFDVPVDRDADRMAEEMGIRIFKADIIYHLFDAFTAYNNEIMEAKRKDAAPQAVWPCRLKTIAAFCKRDPIILGVDILDGTLRVGTPICVVKIDPTTQKKEIIDLGKIASLEINHKSHDIVKKSQAGGGVAVKIEHAVYQSAKMFGRHFDEKDDLLSHVTRQSIDVLKASFKADVSNDEWLLIKALKPRLNIQVYAMSSKSDTVKVDNLDTVDNESTSIIDQDALQLQQLGYKQQLHRSWHFIESFAASFVALNFIGGVRSVLFIGLLAGGPAAIWSSYLITLVFMFITAAVLAEICSALPLSGSIYIWAAESAGPKYARFFGFLVAWWSCTAWMTFTASNCQTTANYIVSLLAVWEVDYPGGVGNDNIQWRALIWAISEGMLLLSVAINYLPPRMYSAIFKFSVGLMMLDFFLCLIWLPIGVSQTYGFRSAKEVFTVTYNGTGAPAGWNWILSLLFTAGTLTGFDASGHIAEETMNASVVAAKGILWSAIATGVLGFITTILFLFCTPDLNTVFALDAPQPFVQIYALALGKKASIFMTLIASLGLIMNTTVSIVAASRLIFAVARDGVLPLSPWIGSVDSKGQPRNAVTVIYIFAAALLCTILPSQVAFTSLVSAGGVPTIAAYALIAMLRLTLTPDHFKSSHYNLGRYAKPFYASAAAFNILVFAVDISPFYFPVTAESFNFAVVIFGAVSIFAVLSWYFMPEHKWLRKEQLMRALNAADGIEEEHVAEDN